MMCDWVSGFIELPPHIAADGPIFDTGKWLKLNQDGEIEEIRSGHLTHKGSFDTGLYMKSPNGTDLYVSGNPVKHLQGHNLYGPDDAIGLYFLAGDTLRSNIGLFPSPSTFLDFTGPRLTRVDYTRSYRFDNNEQANSWIRDICSFARRTHGGTITKGSTVYFGKDIDENGKERQSTYWIMKVYNKSNEIQSRKKGHRLSESVMHRDKLLEWSEGVVRFEVTLFARELVKLRNEGGSPTALQIWQKYHDKIQWNQNAMQTQTNAITREIEGKLPRPVRSTLQHWRAGSDCRELVAKNTYYKHRRIILAELGIDINAKIAEDTISTQTAELDPSRWDPEPLEQFPYNVHECKQKYLAV